MKNKMALQKHVLQKNCFPSHFFFTSFPLASFHLVDTQLGPDLFLISYLGTKTGVITRLYQ